MTFELLRLECKHTNWKSNLNRGHLLKSHQISIIIMLVFLYLLSEQVVVVAKYEM